jgi:hypothetical protein
MVNKPLHWLSLVATPHRHLLEPLQPGLAVEESALLAEIEEYLDDLAVSHVTPFY